MPASNFLRGVTVRLIGVTAAIVLFCGFAVGGLIIYRQHALLLEREANALKITLQDMVPVVVFPHIRRGIAASGEQRKSSFAEAARLMVRNIPFLHHFCILSADRKPRVLYAHGKEFPEAATGAGPDWIACHGPDGLVLILERNYPVPSAGTGKAAGFLHIALSAPTFRRFLIDEARRSAGWLLLSFVLATLAASALFVIMTKSLRSVASYAAAIEHGQFNVELDIKSKDEARTIAEAFNVVLHQLKHSYVSTLGTLAALLETKDRTTETHSLRGVRYAVELGRGAGLSSQEIADLEYGAMLHDIGKIGIADVILKKTGPLTEEEWAVMRQHPTIGYNALRSLDFLQNALPVVLHHQERYDGRGYPNGLKGEHIPILARIFTIADSFDAMTSERPYRKAMRPEVAIQEVKRNAGTQFDPRLVEVFVRIWGEGRLGDPGGPSTLAAAQ